MAVDCSENLEKIRELFVRIAEQDGRNDRSAPLALLELEKRARSSRLSKGSCMIFNNSPRA